MCDWQPTLSTLATSSKQRSQSLQGAVGLHSSVPGIIHWVVVLDIFYFHLYLGKISKLTHIFHIGWFNHQLVQLYTVLPSYQEQTKPMQKKHLLLEWLGLDEAASRKQIL